MKSTMTSVQPYWVFLIIAEAKGWNIPQRKEVEVRKDYPKAKDWDRRNYIYCGKNKASFNRIPKEYQPFMRSLLGKVVAECEIGPICPQNTDLRFYSVFGYRFEDGLTDEELKKYGQGKRLWGWNIYKLKVYDQPKELSEFRLPCDKFLDCLKCHRGRVGDRSCQGQIERAPQSWCYLEEL